MSRQEEMEARLVEENYKITQPRRIILKTLLELQEKHFTAEEVYSRLRQEGAGVGLATVYRTLEVLCKIGILNSLNLDEESRCYELEDVDDHHHHLICLGCGEIKEFSDEMIKDFMKHIEDEYNYKVTDHLLKYYGYCSKCRQAGEGNEGGEEEISPK